MPKVEEKVTFIWQNIHPEKFDPYGCTVRLYVMKNISIRYGNKYLTYF